MVKVFQTSEELVMTICLPIGKVDFEKTVTVDEDINNSNDIQEPDESYIQEQQQSIF